MPDNTPTGAILQLIDDLKAAASPALAQLQANRISAVLNKLLAMRLAPKAWCDALQSEVFEELQVYWDKNNGFDRDGATAP